MESPIIEKYSDDITKMVKAGLSAAEIRNRLFIAYPNIPHRRDSVLRVINTFMQKNEFKVTPVEKAGLQPEISEEDLHSSIKLLFKNKDVRAIEDVSTHLNVGIGQVRAAILEMRDLGHTLSIDNDFVIASTNIPKPDIRLLDVEKMSTGFYKFGICGDNHLCSKYERLDVLNSLYDIFQREGVTDVYNTGNVIDGEARFNKHELLVHGMDAQLDYFIEKYPIRTGITTHYIAGDDHEGWYQHDCGVEIGKYLLMRAKAAGRTDLDYLGYMEADIVLKAPNGQTVMRVLHPGGGSSYAVSYTVQKIVESYQGGEKPHILLAGHYHKADYTYTRGVHCIQTACTTDQSPFMRKKRLAAHLGGWIIEFATDDNGAITRFKQEFFPYYDNGYYQQWKFKH